MSKTEGVLRVQFSLATVVGGQLAEFSKCGFLKAGYCQSPVVTRAGKLDFSFPRWKVFALKRRKRQSYHVAWVAKVEAALCSGAAALRDKKAALPLNAL